MFILFYNKVIKKEDILTKISFKLQSVTPLFMIGANNYSCEFRSSSIKGCIRYWFRAIYPNLLSEEKRLFGSTDFRSPLIIRSRSIKPVFGSKGDKSWNKSSISYLGFGAIDFKGTTQSFFKVGSVFDLELVFKGSLDATDQSYILNSVWGLFMLGGVGSRSRRGFGCMRVLDVQDEYGLLKNIPPFKFNNRNEYVDAVKKFIQLQTISNKQHNHTAFSSDMQLIITRDNHPSMVVLEKIGKNFQYFRSYIRDRQYPEDHDIMLNFLQKGIPPKKSPDRAAFGLPHNYFFPSRPSMIGGVDILDGDQKGRKGQKGRRGSPLFIHIQGFEKGTSCGVFIFMPAPLIPENDKIVISGSKSYRRDVKVDPPDYSGVEKYLKHLIQKGEEKIL